MPAILVLGLIFIILLILVSCIRIVPQAQAMVVRGLAHTWKPGTWESTLRFRLSIVLQSAFS